MRKNKYFSTPALFFGFGCGLAVSLLCGAIIAGFGHDWMEPLVSGAAGSLVVCLAMALLPAKEGQP